MIDCARARSLLPRHVKSALIGDEQAAFRQHILVCTECRDSYRTAIAMTAKVGHGLAEARFERARRERRAEARALPFRVGSFGRNRKGYWMRAMIGTALLITLVTRLPGWTRPPMLDVTWINGGVQAGTKELSGGDSETELVTGDWVITTANGAARVESRRASLEVGAGTAILVEDPKTFRIRFQRGTLELSGRALVATQYGFASLDGGSAQLSSTIDGLEIRVLDGGVTWTHPGGVEQLDAGEEGLARHPGPLVAVR